MAKTKNISKRNIRRILKKYIDEDFVRDYGDAYVILLNAHLGSGKTASLEQFKHLKVLYIASSKELIEQVCQRYTWLNSYIKEDGKTRKASHEIKMLEKLAINYHSLHKLSDDYDMDYDIVIIDEPFALWESSSTYKINASNEAEFLYRIRNTPKVIFMGGDFPKFIIKEIKTIIKKRPKALGDTLTELKYSFPIDRDMHVEFVNNKKDRESFINRQLRLRQERKEYLEDNPFHIQEASFQIEKDEYYQPSDWETHNNTKGVLITTEYGESVKTQAEKWQNAFPELDIRYINASNSHLSTELRDSLSDPEKYSNVDMLVISPSWSTGINIVNEFDIVVGDFARNREVPLTPREIYQSLHRERNAKIHIIQISKGNTLDEYNGIPEYNEENFSEFLKICSHYGYNLKAYKKRQENGTNRPHTDLIGLLERRIEVMNDNILERTARGLFVWQMYQKNGWNKEEQYEDYVKDLKKKEWSKLPVGVKSKHKERLTGLEEHTKQSLEELEEACQTLGIDPTRSLTGDEYIQFDEGHLEGNRQRKSYLHNFTQLDEPTQECVSLVNRILERFTNMFMNEKILTSEMIIDTKVYKNIKTNKPRYDALLRTYLDTFIEMPSMTVKEQDVELLKWVEEILRKHYFKVAFSNGGCRANYKEAKKEHNADFLKWKKTYKAEYNPKGYLRYEDYLFIGLTNKTIEWRKLGTESRKLVEQFPHLKITDYKWETPPVEARG